MSQKSGIFNFAKLCQKTVGFFMVFWCMTAYGAGYTCPTSKRYTSCNAGYYMTGGTGAGNACTACPDGCTCADNTTPECHADKPCAGNLADATGGTITWNGSAWDYSACYKTCSGGGIAYGLSYYTGTAWGTCRPETASYGCHWGYYNNNGQSCDTCPAGSWCWNYAKPCPAGYVCPAGIYDPTYEGYGDRYKCPDGYTSDAGATGTNKCYKSCTRACTQQSCPANASCTHGTSSTSGVEYYGGTCNAAETTCTLSFSCNPGYYGSSSNGDTACADCGNGNYCTGGTHRATCASTLKDGAPIPDTIITTNNGSWDDHLHAASSDDCVCDWYFSDESREKYLQERLCKVGPASTEFTRYSWCRTGYYASSPLTWGNWYSACSPCTNKPANAHFTDHGTPSVMYAVEDNCPWECDDGYGRTSDDTCAQMCSTGITQIRAGNITVPLYAMPQTAPALHVQLPGKNACYGSLASGGATGAVNVQYGGMTYHSID